jgi:sensor histidine kinase regulating citrate/malate metabolism
MIVNGYLVMRDVIQLKKWKERIKLREEAYSYIEKLNRDLRMQRHDFLNHIQIIYSLMELEEYNECVEYLNKIYEHIGKLNKNIKTDKVAINALLQAKSNEADKLHIQYQVIITTRLSNLIIPEWELCRCLGNLIDNAFRATIEYNGNRNISIMIEEDLVSYQLSVHNVGNPIKIEYIDKLFEEGFTTKEKNNQEHGIGLYIVKDILDKYNSNIDIKRIDDKTVFTIRIPKEKV